MSVEERMLFEVSSGCLASIRARWRAAGIIVQSDRGGPGSEDNFGAPDNVRNATVERPRCISPCSASHSKMLRYQRSSRRLSDLADLPHFIT